MENYKEQLKFCDRFANCDEFEAYLKSLYPKLFDDCFDFHVDKGWWPLLIDAAEFLESKRTSSPNVSFAQVKEKFGLLRIYVDGFEKNDYSSVYEKIAEFEFLSKNYCEKCGSQENVENTSEGQFGWIKNYCANCHASRYKK